MPPKNWLGNDIVSLMSPDSAGKSGDERFIGRVCTPGERERVRASAHPDAALWALWAAKEAAFKAVVKYRPGTVFSPSSFVVTEDLDGTGGSVAHADLRVRVRWEMTTEWVHCIALLNEHGTPPAWSDVPSGVARLTAEEDAGLPGAAAASRQVRALAKRLLAEAGIAGAEIVRDPLDDSRWGPPFVLSPTLRRVDVSLSHDGDWIAAAIYQEADLAQH